MRRTLGFRFGADGERRGGDECRRSDNRLHRTRCVLAPPFKDSDIVRQPYPPRFYGNVSRGIRPSLVDGARHRDQQPQLAAALPHVRAVGVHHGITALLAEEVACATSMMFGVPIRTSMMFGVPIRMWTGPDAEKPAGSLQRACVYWFALISRSQI